MAILTEITNPKIKINQRTLRFKSRAAAADCMGGPGPCVDHSLRNRLNFRVPRVSKVDYVSPQLRTAYATSGSFKGTQLVRHSGMKQERLGRSPYDTSCVKICLPGNWAGSKQGLLQPVITHFNKYPPLSPAAIRKIDWIRCNNYPCFWRILSSHVTVSILVWISYISLHWFNKRKTKTFRNFETTKGTLVHSPAGYSRTLGMQQRVLRFNVK